MYNKNAKWEDDGLEEATHNWNDLSQTKRSSGYAEKRYIDPEPPEPVMIKTSGGNEIPEHILKGEVNRMDLRHGVPVGADKYRLAPIYSFQTLMDIRSGKIADPELSDGDGDGGDLDGDADGGDWEEEEDW